MDYDNQFGASFAIVIACFLLWLYFALVHPLKAFDALHAANAPATHSLTHHHATHSTHDGVISPVNAHVQVDACAETVIGEVNNSIALTDFRPSSIVDRNTFGIEDSINPIISDLFFHNAKNSVGFIL